MTLNAHEIEILDVRSEQAAVSAEWHIQGEPTEADVQAISGTHWPI